MARSANVLEITRSSWNPVTGCTKVSPGCKNCYAERFALRHQREGMARYVNGFSLTLQPDLLHQPLRWRQPRIVFTCSMADLFHEDVPTAYIRQVFATMERAHWHTFHVLTKRADRLVRLAPSLPWPKNIWLGVSVERQDYAWRIGRLRKVPASKRFLSVEPLLGPLPNLDLTDIDWVVLGGESGPNPRLLDGAWVRGIRDQRLHADVKFTFKQWGGKDRQLNGRELDGRTWTDMPEPVRLSEQLALPLVG
jgi:protein gp37